MINQSPLVSVIMPVFNAGEELSSSFGRLRALTYPNLEFILVDDGSSDETPSLLASFARTESRARIVRLETNSGAAVARNLGLASAKGDYVWFVDWDDSWSGLIVEKLVAVATALAADLVTCRGTWRLPSGMDVGITDGSNRPQMIGRAEAFDCLLSGRIKGYLWTKLFRREILATSGAFPDITTQEDLVGVARALARAEKVALIPDVLYHHVIRDGSLSNSRNPPLANLTTARNAVHEIARSIPSTPRRHQYLEYFDYAFWRIARASTAVRLSDIDVAHKEVAAAQKGITLAGAIRVSRVSPHVGAKAAALKLTGARYILLRNAAVSLRRLWRWRHSLTRAANHCSHGVTWAANIAAARGLGTKVLVRTLPLRRGNYGGILQAFALQRALTELGVVAVTDLSERLPFHTAMRKLLLRVASRATRRPIGYDERVRHKNAALERFIARHMNTTRVFRFNWRPRQRLIAQYPIMIVGSDQVWRREYGDVESYLFDFAHSGQGTRLVAYGASFGSDHPDLPGSLRPLAQRLTAVSVRENSAIDICRTHWGVMARRVPDPTLLIDADEYRQLADDAPATALPAEPNGYVLAYVLDDSPRKARILAELGEALGAPTARLASPHGPSSDLAPRASVESWLRSFRDARAIVTDSFHGCVFALIFNRPFIALGNPQRGNARFDTLLGTFGLTDRLVSLDELGDPTRAIADLINQEIRWDLVNQTIAEEAASGREFLRHALTGDS